MTKTPSPAQRPTRIARSPSASWDSQSKVVWLYGDQSPLTVPELCAAIARGIAFDEEDLMLDLGNASSIDDSVVEVIVLAREYLRQRSRSVAIRSVTPSACRVFVLCGLAELVVSDAGTYRLTQPMASRA